MYRILSQSEAEVISALLGLYQRFGNGTLYDRAEIDANFLIDLLSLKDHEGGPPRRSPADEFLAAIDLARRMDDLIQRQAH